MEPCAVSPAPGILETARDVYAGNDVREISASHADNLHVTVDAIRTSIAKAKAHKQRWVCFVTGVPGSGKTLVGPECGARRGGWYSGRTARRVHERQWPAGRSSPLRDRFRPGEPDTNVERRGDAAAKTFIQPVHQFVRELASSDVAPPENVLVFDEAQRAWDAEQMSKKQRIPASEAATTLRIMERARDWAVIVALVGDGQEINTGEAGIEEWFAALAAHPRWEAVGASEIAARAPSGAVQTDDALHLGASVRSPRAVAIADWAGAVVHGDLGTARTLTESFTAIPCT